MSIIDWVIMLSTLLSIVIYGVVKTRRVDNVKSYLMGDKDLPWYTIGLSIMATQASAITFLSVPGQAYESGMGFAQFYFAMPIAMIILCIFVLPIYYKLNVYTAYEYLEGRFNASVRALTAILFLVQRGLAAGITIFAPAIILTNILGWNLRLTVLILGIFVIFYTVMGGTKAVSVTQKQQMIVILSGMFIAAVITVLKMPVDVGFQDALSVAGKLGKLEVVNFEFDLSNRYNFWSGMIGGLFLFLSYFGTDQSQVQRYLSGKSLNQSRMGLLFNGIIKVPMQFLVLLVGIMVFIFFQFQKAPIHFNNSNLYTLEASAYAGELETIEKAYDSNFEEKKVEIYNLMEAIESKNASDIENKKAVVLSLQDKENELRTSVKELIVKADPLAETKDDDYVFISFITDHMPVGLVGLLLAVIFSAAMSSTSSELNALATTSVIDIYKRFLFRDKSDKHYLTVSKFMTVFWGCVAMFFAMIASLFDNLIEAVNIIGSLFYGTILGVFVVAFFFKFVQGRAVFIAAFIAEALVVTVFTLDYYGHIEIAYLWLNLIGCILVIIFACLFQTFMSEEKKTTAFMD